MKTICRPAMLRWALYSALLVAMPVAHADSGSVQLICDDSGPVNLDYASNQVTFHDHVYPMEVTEKSVTWQVYSEITKLTYTYTLDRFTGELQGYSLYAKPQAWLDHCKVGGQKF